jgi:hypothetical protein
LITINEIIFEKYEGKYSKDDLFILMYETLQDVEQTIANVVHNLSTYVPGELSKNEPHVAWAARISLAKLNAVLKALDSYKVD